jgi:hypothetical protein
VLQEIDAAKLHGTLIGVPIVNLHGFRQASRYLPDRRDLNRHFPGRENGSAASRIAYSVFSQVIRRCDGLVDLHTGSFHRSNVPQVRADLTDSGAFELATAFGAGVVVHAVGEAGTLRRAARDVGIPAISYEAGEPMRFQPELVEQGVRGVLELLERKGMLVRNVRRGLAPARRLHEAGVNVAVSTNNVQNPFTPFGDCDLLRVANILATAGHFGTVEDLVLVLRMATEHGARALRMPDHGVREGARADLVVLDCAEPAEAVGALPERLLVMKNGAVVVTNRVETTFSRPPAPPAPR